MPKSQYVDPAKAFEAGYIHFEDIPVCQYNKTLAEEKKLYTKADFMRIYRDMAIIREFETMLNEVKTKSCYNGVEYNNPGPAHLPSVRKHPLSVRHTALTSTTFPSALTEATVKFLQRVFLRSTSSTTRSFTIS